MHLLKKLIALTSRVHPSIFINKGYNQIEDEGCDYLSQGKWPFLTQFIRQLEFNYIDYEGCTHASSAQSPLLKTFYRS